MIVVFISNLSERLEERNKIVHKDNRFDNYEQPVYSYDINLFALELHYTSVQAHKVVRKEIRQSSLLRFAINLEIQLFEEIESLNFEEFRELARKSENSADFKCAKV